MVFKPATFHGETPEIIGQEPPDASLETAVADALARTATTDASRVEVTASGSTITLSGVGDPQAAEEVAGRVPGVTEIINLITSG